jgi:hypothetical protein
MGVFTQRRRRRASRDYLTPEGHRQEAERLAWVIDDVLQSDAERNLPDLIALARLHLDMAYPASDAETAAEIARILRLGRECMIVVPRTVS